MGFLFHQLPKYNTLYMHVFKGVFYESKIVVLELQKVALQSDKSMRAYIKKYLNNSDLDFQRMGGVMMKQIERHQRYKKLLKLLKETNPFFRHLVLLYHFEYNIVKQVEYTPGLLLNSIGGVYYLLGCFIGLGLLWSISWLRRPKFLSQI